MLHLFCFHFPILSDTNKNTDSKLHNLYKVIVFLHPEDVKTAFFKPILQVRALFVCLLNQNQL